ncbi:5082_t:CDS:2 [Racocetra fulgida]|uniref:5082_t:CDS:1 n=1 Tax=Racocetra fulgida TaxID=60492 RepID=A0A9N8Z9F5_9GLOM|nr:5082_t:CDS:2 [Racocetra fulgida]
MENINYDESYSVQYSSNSDSESVTEIENFPILNFDIDTYQDVKNKILQQNSDNDNEDYDLNNVTEESTLSEFNEEFGCDNKHDDLSAILEKFGNWIQLVAKSDNKLQKKQLIWSLLPAIETLKPCLPKDLIYSKVDDFDKLVLPTFLMIQIAFKLAKIDLSTKAKAAFLKEKEYTYCGNLLGESL